MLQALLDHFLSSIQALRVYVESVKIKITI